jgi:hypothetical protein
MNKKYVLVGLVGVAVFLLVLGIFSAAGAIGGIGRPLPDRAYKSPGGDYVGNCDISGNMRLKFVREEGFSNRYSFDIEYDGKPVEPGFMSFVSPLGFFFPDARDIKVTPEIRLGTGWYPMNSILFSDTSIKSSTTEIKRYTMRTLPKQGSYDLRFVITYNIDDGWTGVVFRRNVVNYVEGFTVDCQEGVTKW